MKNYYILNSQKLGQILRVDKTGLLRPSHNNKSIDFCEEILVQSDKMFNIPKLS